MLRRTKDCDGKAKVKCANFVYRNERLATDTEKCEYVKNVIQRKIRKTDYPVMPFVPKFLGYNYNLPYQPKENSDEVIKSRDLHTQQMTLRQAEEQEDQTKEIRQTNDRMTTIEYDSNRRADLAGC